ncbi:conserved Plasmodium protein, unknown function, partial [Plasmodium malariae]
KEKGKQIKRNNISPSDEIKNSDVENDKSKMNDLNNDNNEDDNNDELLTNRLIIDSQHNAGLVSFDKKNGCLSTNLSSNTNEKEELKKNLLISLLNINFKEEIKRTIQNACAKIEKNEKIVFNVSKQINDIKLQYILKKLLKGKNSKSEKNNLKILKIQKRKILQKNFYQKSNKSKAITLEYVLNPTPEVYGNMNCIVRSEDCLLTDDKEKRNIEKIINANFEITATTVSVATPAIVNVFKNDEYE